MPRSQMGMFLERSNPRRLLARSNVTHGEPKTFLPRPQDGGRQTAGRTAPPLNAAFELVAFRPGRSAGGSFESWATKKAQKGRAKQSSQPPVFWKWFEGSPPDQNKTCSLPTRPSLEPSGTAGSGTAAKIPRSHFPQKSWELTFLRNKTIAPPPGTRHKAHRTCCFWKAREEFLRAGPGVQTRHARKAPASPRR